MSQESPNHPANMSRRDLLKLSALGTLAATGTSLAGGNKPKDRSQPPPAPEDFFPTHYSAEKYTYYKKLKAFDVKTPLAPNEMRISFMGSAIPPFGRAQRMMSIYVEVGWVPDEYRANDPNNTPQTPVAFKPQDQFIFDLGPGVFANYISMNVPFYRMNKVFINHLHGDHTGELIGLYGLGGGNRMSPLFIFGPGQSGVSNPGNSPTVSASYPYPRDPKYNYSTSPVTYTDDGTLGFCQYFREANRWQSEAFSFQPTSYASYEPPTKDSWGLPCEPVPVGDDPVNDAFALIPIELDWTKCGDGYRDDGSGLKDNVAYHNAATGVTVSHFPVIHCRQGSIGYKLEWTPPGAGKPLTMIYTSDTKPEWNSVNQAVNGGQGVDVFIHEMVIPPEIWAMKTAGLSDPDDVTPHQLDYMTQIQNSSHTSQGAFGYILSQIKEQTGKLPRLTVATHFPTTDDNVTCALESVQEHVPDIGKLGQNLVWSYDCMVLRVFPDRIEQYRGDANDYAYIANPPYSFYDPLPPKYHKDDGSMNPYYQIDTTDAILSTEEIAENGGTDVTYRKDGY